MKSMREKVQTKLNSMASILLDDVIVPDKNEQEGNESISASYYDKYGNKFTFSLSLTVVPKVKDEDPTEETPLTTSEQISAILTKVTALEEDVGVLKSYHTSSDTPSVENQEDPTNQGSDQNGEQQAG